MKFYEFIRDEDLRFEIHTNLKTNGIKRSIIETDLIETYRTIVTKAMLHSKAIKEKKHTP